MLHFFWMKLLLRLHPPSLPQTLEHMCTFLSDMEWHCCDGLKQVLFTWAHYTSWPAINTMELKVPWIGLGKKVSGLKSRGLLRSSWVPSPLSPWEAQGHLMPSSGGHLTPLVSEHTHLHSHPHAHCQTLTHTHCFKNNKIKIERVSGFNYFTTLEQRGCGLNL